MTKLAPDVGSLVVYGTDSFGKPQRWRVQSWIRQAPAIAPIDVNKDSFGEILQKILNESCQKIDGKRWQFCLRHEATHVSLYAVCGTMAPIEACVVEGHVLDGPNAWSREHYEDALTHAVRLGSAHEMIF